MVPDMTRRTAAVLAAAAVLLVGGCSTGEDSPADQSTSTADDRGQVDPSALDAALQELSQQQCSTDLSECAASAQRRVEIARVLVVEQGGAALGEAAEELDRASAAAVQACGGDDRVACVHAWQASDDALTAAIEDLRRYAIAVTQSSTR